MRFQARALVLRVGTEGGYRTRSGFELGDKSVQRLHIVLSLTMHAQPHIHLKPCDASVFKLTLSPLELRYGFLIDGSPHSQDSARYCSSRPCLYLWCAYDAGMLVANYKLAQPVC